MAGENTLATLNGNFKQVYADKIVDLIPENVKFTKMVDFVSAEKTLGDQYNQPVILANEHGTTFANTGDAFALNAAVAGQIKNATLNGLEIVLRSQLSYAAAARAQNGRNAFIDSTQLLVKNMRRSIATTLEVQLLYGSAGLGIVNAIATNTITLDAAEWASGIWAGSVGMKLTAYDLLTGGTIQNTANSGVMTVVSVDIANKAVTVDDATGVAANDILFPLGAYAKEMNGLHSILTNTGTLFDISAATYDLWQAESYAVAGALSFAKVTKAVAQGVGKGLDGDVTLLVSPITWQNLIQVQDSARVFDSSFSNVNIDQGTQEITFFSQNGKISIVPSFYVKEGFGYIVNPKEWVRPGSTDVTFDRPGQSDAFFMDLESSAGYELRAYTDQALFCEAPGHQIILTGIVNT